jgi:radical SAM protein with 4Fe4S-binding SPASM domain
MDIFEKVNKLEITEKTKLNILRKSDFIDEVHFDEEGYPKPSWIDISITELCNRRCVFCPRADPEFYPNQNLHFSIDLAKKMAGELIHNDYKGGVVFCGYGEPLLHPRIYDLISAFKGIHLEIVTNGDKLSPKKIKSLYEAGTSFLCVSMYDGPEQVDKLNQMFSEAEVDQERYILRDRWHKEDDSFGLKLTNRSGVMDFGPDTSEFKNHPCYYTAYSMAIDWNGDVLLCVQDWNKKVKLGNVANQEIMAIWRSIIMHKIRKKLMCGDRSSSPCNNCNADGTVHGFNHVNSWSRVDSE